MPDFTMIEGLEVKNPHSVWKSVAHRPAYGTDGDYFSKPSVEDMVEAAYGIMNEAGPSKHRQIF